MLITVIFNTVFNLCCILGVQMDDLLEQLAVADSLQDQADILYCIYLQK